MRYQIILVLFYLWSKVETFETLPNQYLPCIGLGTLYQYTGDVETKNNGMVLHMYIYIYIHMYILDYGFEWAVSKNGEPKISISMGKIMIAKKLEDSKFANEDQNHRCPVGSNFGFCGIQASFST